MKKFLAIYMLTFLSVLSVFASVEARDHRHNKKGYLRQDKLNEETVDDVQMWTYIGIEKVVDSQGPRYGFWCGVESSVGGGGDLSAALLALPNNKKMWMIGTSGLGHFDLGTWGLDFNEFTQEFPQGPYIIVPFPHTDSFKFVNIAYNFPPTPNVTFPIDGQTNVSLTPTITWAPIPGIDYIWLGIFEENGPGEIEVDLDPGVTSFTIPDGSGALKPNTRYFVLLGGGKDIGYEIESTRLFYFTTGN